MLKIVITVCGRQLTCLSSLVLQINIRNRFKLKYKTYYIEAWTSSQEEVWVIKSKGTIDISSLELFTSHVTKGREMYQIPFGSLLWL